MNNRQMIFDLAGAPRLGVEDFMVSPANADAFAAVERWPHWPAPSLMLIGPRGSGKTHLTAIWARKAGARVVCAADLRGEDAPALAAGPVAVEDVERVGAQEAALFHLINLARERGAPMLTTAASDPAEWGLKTPDLLSRLRLSAQVRLDGPDEALMRAVLVKLFMDRQLAVDVGVVETLALHLDRSLDAARAMVEALDARSLAEGRRITRAMARDAVREAGITMQQEFWVDVQRER